MLSPPAELQSDLAVLDATVRNLVEGRLLPVARHEAREVAARLAGASGAAGYPGASRLALQVVGLLSRPDLDQSQAPRLARLLDELRQDLEGPALVGPRPGGESSTMLLWSTDGDVVQGLRTEALARGVGLVVVRTADEARQALALRPPQGFLADLPTPARLEEGFDLLARGPGRSFPVALLGEAADQSQRARAARLGVGTFLSPLLPPRLVAGIVLDVMERQGQVPPRVLAVQPDMEEFARLAGVLERDQVELLRLEDPDRLWQVLQEWEPDALLLVADACGLELCRIVRQEPRWWSLPILCLADTSNPAGMRAAFDAGADDCLCRPLAGGVLMPCLRSRLDRHRRIRRLAESDPFTGVAAREPGLEVLERYLKLGHRHGKTITFGLLEVEGLAELRARHGRAAGDMLLRRLGRLLVGTFRAEDVVARWTEDRFGVVLFGCPQFEAVDRLNAALAEFRQRTFLGPSQEPFQGSFAWGLAERGGADQTPEALEIAAAEALDRGARARASGDPDLSRESSARRVDVVLVDADPALSSLLLHALADRGYTTLGYDDGNQALEELGGLNPRVRPRLILLDIDLPGLSGLQVLKRLREAGVLRTARVLVVTVRAVESEILEALGLGALDHISKPFSLPVLMQRVEKAIRR